MELKSMLWQKIRTAPGCRQVTPPNGDPGFFLFKTSMDDTGWLVAAYKDLTKFATALRDGTSLRDFLSENRIRIGLRDTDVPPANLRRQPGYGEFVQGANPGKDFSTARVNPMAQPVQPDQTFPINRKSDREENVKSFWQSQTPQSHHIVEFNNLQTLGVSRKEGIGEMDYLQLPAVLLAAEFHQRYISAILKPTQRLKRNELAAEIVFDYQKVYVGRSRLFEPLWMISRIILGEANLKI